uniref:Uncharacterized protein n=1 Tax=Arion vulgaris TaxID=1028688 RepID=A0A0B6YX85_9EUPU
MVSAAVSGSEGKGVEGDVPDDGECGAMMFSCPLMVEDIVSVSADPLGDRDGTDCTSNWLEPP